MIRVPPIVVGGTEMKKWNNKKNGNFFSSKSNQSVSTRVFVLRNNVIY